jgi:m7GpppX diphosphatase
MSNAEPIRSPAVLLQDNYCQAQTLTISNDHATILLRRTDANGAFREHSLLKVNVVPTHKEELAFTNSVRGLSVDELSSVATDQDSQRILAFLRNLDFRLTSESGAEYSYYNASGKTWWQSPWKMLYSVFASTNQEAFKVELISPASDRQIQRSLPTPAFSLVEETSNMYQQTVEPYIRSIVEGGGLSWIHNVVQAKKEVERLLLNTDDFVLNVDTKWKSHPDALTVPRQEWHGHASVNDLYCLAIVKDGSIASLRDLRGDKHLPMLRAILNEGPRVLQEVYGVPRDQLRIFCHYQPQFYHFHVHFTRLENEIGCQVERGHLLSDIVQNLEMDHDYYAKRTISYKLKTSDTLFTLLSRGGK